MKTLPNQITEKHKKAADFYFGGDTKKEAMIKAGYSVSYAQTKSSLVFDNPLVVEYLNKLHQEQYTDPAIADAKETLTFITAVMRGEVREQFDLDPALDTRMDAAKCLQKRYGLDKLALIGGGKDDEPVKTEETVHIYLPENNRCNKQRGDDE